MTAERTYDVAISYASEDRRYAEDLANALKNRGVKVFYDQDQDEQADIWGKNLVDILSDIYENRAHYCIIIFSKNYAIKKWTKLERRVAQNRALEEIGEYILPICLDKTQVPDFLSTIGSISWHENEKTVGHIVDMIVKKLPPKKPSSQVREEPEWFKLLRKGNEFFKHQKYNDALVAYKQAIDLEPDNPVPVVYNNKGVTLHQLGRYEDALETLQEAIHLDPNDDLAYYKEALQRAFQCDINLVTAYTNAVAYNNKARTLYKLKSYDESLSACEYAIRLDANFAAAYDTKGRILNRRKRYDQALIECELAILLDPKLAEAYDDKGWALYGLKRYNESLAVCEQAIWLDSHLASAYNNKGRVLNELGRNKEALDAYERSIKFNPDAKVYNNKGQTLRNLKNFTGALEAYEEAIRHDSNDATAYHNKGQVLLYRLKRYDEALEAFNQAIKLYRASEGTTKLESKLAIAYRDKGLTLSAEQKHKKALKAFEEAIRLDSELADSYTGKGHALRALGQRREAQEAFAKAERLRQRSG